MKFVLLVLLFALSACGGGDPETVVACPSSEVAAELTQAYLAELEAGKGSPLRAITAVAHFDASFSKAASECLK